MGSLMLLQLLPHLYEAGCQGGPDGDVVVSTLSDTAAKLTKDFNRSIQVDRSPINQWHHSCHVRELSDFIQIIITQDFSLIESPCVWDRNWRMT